MFTTTCIEWFYKILLFGSIALRICDKIALLSIWNFFKAFISIIDKDIIDKRRKRERNYAIIKLNRKSKIKKKTEKKHTY